MTGLTSPLSEIDPEAWTVRLLAHSMLGLLAWHALIWTLPPVVAAVAVPVIYLVAWEIAVQRVGAGWWDAFLDTLAVGLGAALGLELLDPNPAHFMAVTGLGASALAHGVWRRRNDA